MGAAGTPTDRGGDNSTGPWGSRKLCVGGREFSCGLITVMRSSSVPDHRFFFPCAGAESISTAHAMVQIIERCTIVFFAEIIDARCCPNNTGRRRRPPRVYLSDAAWNYCCVGACAALVFGG